MKSAKIVVIDDDMAYLDLLRDALSEEGFAVVASADSRTAFELVDREQPQAVILDVRMEHPDSGLIILDMLRLHRRTAHIPVVMCSADANLLCEHADAFADHECSVLAKPFALDQLFRRLRETIGRS
ncbi:MAG TPA: response regulator [Herpetosiphonaceae bacterium]